jgi:hypothetical protein
VEQSSLNALKSRFAKSTQITEIELHLHFVNKERDPTKLPVLKRYSMKADEAGKKFLSQFEFVAKKASSYYQ